MTEQRSPSRDEGGGPSHAMIPDGPPPVVGLAEVSNLLGISKSRVSALAAQPDFPAAAMLAAGPVWWRSQIERYGELRRADPAKRKGVRLPANWALAEQD